MSVRKPITPLDVLRNCRAKVVSVELAGGETINGTVVRVDRAMNMVLKQCIRTSADGEAFWRSRESLIRGASVRNVRMDERAVIIADAQLREVTSKSKNKNRVKAKSNDKQQGERKATLSGEKRNRGK
ncbi:U6 snRNA-associated Sm-like protein LSm4p [Trypanosoma brucei brucei TREU927]|uniref:U6 snRNA-associated Sm-like protein LSm4 n=2 Tax=Trypanosoma brucei TaxID=5691 RepID=Q382E1_TRYB2|nr:U6 snRNA-associated Sm-like protein LSm4p [Trypanosoma brucei brucei TREU927]AAS57926.1 Lsm4p [Trypanosoma brucei]EAN80340.1 U6 snRNA-associated Sm-like protein LSm4p [Trypanosoma brucei brucei TREU927]